MSHVFHRSSEPIMAERARGAWVYDSEGKAYLDAAGGAIVCNVGHGSPRVVAALESAATLDYVHPSVFTTAALENYAAALAPYVPVDDVRIFPTSGGAESVETAIKLSRSYHLARGDGDRHIVVSRRQSYHGNTLGALRVSSREPLRAPYRTWLGEGWFAPEVSEYRCPNPGHPSNCAAWHAAELDAVFTEVGAEQVAAFIGEAVGGATLAAAVAPEGYWEAIGEVCDRHGVLLIVDEIMTGFGRTGKWFAVDAPRPDIMVSGKGAAGGYWPFGLCMASGRVHDVVMGASGFTHGYTFSHSPVGAGVAHAVLDELVEGDLVVAAANRGAALLSGLTTALGGIPIVGDVRGVGLLIGIEFVVDRESKEPFPRADRLAEKIAGLARDLGLLVYPSVGCADGRSGDAVLLGPPLSITDEEVGQIVDRLSNAVGRAA